MSFRCEICKRGPMDDPPVTVYRQNEKGEPGVYRCETCSEKPIDRAVRDLVQSIEEEAKP